MPGLSNYPPGVTGNEPQITGISDDPEALYLVCDDCGEAFHIEAAQEAHDHAHDEMIDARFYLCTETEAF